MASKLGINHYNEEEVSNVIRNGEDDVQGMKTDPFIGEDRLEKDEKHLMTVHRSLNGIVSMQSVTAQWGRPKRKIRKRGRLSYTDYINSIVGFK